MKRHPMLVARDKAYANAVQHSRLTVDGKMKVNKMPLAEDLVGLRPLSKEEQISRYSGHGIVDFNLVPDDKFFRMFPEHACRSDDDFLDHLDDLPEEGLSPFELAGIANAQHYINSGRGFDFVPRPEASEEEASPEASSPERAHNAGGGEDAPGQAAGKSTVQTS